ncbi:HK97 gp10 family phage protein [Veillonella magna]|uniref:HK97 gp10 family phage protein n=1 Tax=Veillonella magna TaxID=464322 RepID=A0ABS2GIW9_9FIRM|nr:HK97 gp10 family phage protein [Veillonella magna]MBM6824792.1 HK97 gp10 family phage protein [Veillonella magna]MBM6913129.1 HK97 gp10 family phage protein [Veillonella magna]
MAFHFEGDEAFLDKLRRVQEAGQSKINTCVRKLAEDIKSDTIELTPVDTGQLREGWKKSRVKQGRCEVYNETHYVRHVEYGHRKRGGKGVVKGRKMLHTAMDNFKDEYPERVAKVIGDILNA